MFESFKVETSQPSVNVPLQSAKPVEHVPTAQTLLRQTSVATLLSAAQAVQLPQCAGSWASSTHEVPQMLSPAPQSVPHAPEEQTVPAPQVVPFVLVPVAALQRPAAPQYVVSVSGLMQVPLQLMKPVAQTRPQVPPEQTSPVPHAVPLLSAGFPSLAHVPLAPQKPGFVSGFTQVVPQRISSDWHSVAQLPWLQT